MPAAGAPSLSVSSASHRSTDRPSGTSPPRWWLRLDPPQALLVALLAVALLHFLLPGIRLVPREWFWGCLALAALGLAISQFAAVQMRRAGTPFEFGLPPSALLTGGMFRCSRNPMYGGMLLLLAGEAAMLGTVGALLPLPAYFLAIRYGFVKVEERQLRQAFGPSYLDYQRRVRRWL